MSEIAQFIAAMPKAEPTGAEKNIEFTD